MESPSAQLLRDPVSSLTHLLMCVFAVYATLVLWRLSRGDRTKQFSIAVFAVSAVLLYATSGTYHAIPLPTSSPAVATFRRLDHSAIYLLIAGTYTPVFAVLLRGRLRAILLSLVWGLALIGVAGKWIAPLSNERWTVGLYLALGWLIFVVALNLYRAVGWRGVAWGTAGGLCYTAGAVCELLHWPILVPGVFSWHEVCHVLDMAGTAIHVVFMIRCIIPYRGPVVARNAASRVMTKMSHRRKAAAVIDA